jgi:hypothetical protein
MTFDAMVDRILALFDIEQPIAVSFVNERHKRMVGEAEFRLAETSFGTTVASQSDYAFDDSIEGLRYVQLGADSEPYIRADDLQMVGLRNGSAQVDGAPGAFSFYGDSSGNEKLRLFPTPTTAGTAIIGWASIEPADIAYGSGGTFLPPQHLHPYILDGALADAYEQIESRWDLATPHDQRFEAGVEKLRRYKNLRIRRRSSQIVRGW